MSLCLFCQGEKIFVIKWVNIWLNSNFFLYSLMCVSKLHFITTSWPLGKDPLFLKSFPVLLRGV